MLQLSGKDLFNVEAFGRITDLVGADVRCQMTAAGM